LDLVERASEIFEEVILAVAERPTKDTMFNAEQRIEMAQEVIKDYSNVTATLFGGLLVEFAEKRKIHVLVRGIRAYSDFEYEFQMALTNRKLAPRIETMFLMPKETHSYMSSRAVREIALLGGDFSGLVPECVNRYVSGSLSDQVGSR
jgi:pantetheine-phosphate adenylyltransferase